MLRSHPVCDSTCQRGSVDVGRAGEGLRGQRRGQMAMTLKETACAACEATEVSVFYRMGNAPVHSVLLMRSREKALTYPTAEIALGFCRSCGFVSNVAFEPGRHEYAGECEATQAFSPTWSFPSR